MRCGIECVSEYLKLLDVEVSFPISELEHRMTPKGISIYDIINVLEKHCIEAHVYKCFFVCPKPPFIVYLSRKKHYLLVKKTGLFVELFDNNVGWIKIPVFIYFFISKRYVIVLDKM